MNWKRKNLTAFLSLIFSLCFVSETHAQVLDLINWRENITAKMHNGFWITHHSLNVRISRLSMFIITAGKCTKRIYAMWDRINM